VERKASREFEDSCEPQRFLEAPCFGAKSATEGQKKQKRQVATGKITEALAICGRGLLGMVSV
jgi:hypothetical protein